MADGPFTKRRLAKLVGIVIQGVLRVRTVDREDFGVYRLHGRVDPLSSLEHRFQ